METEVGMSKTLEQIVNESCSKALVASFSELDSCADSLFPKVGRIMDHPVPMEPYIRECPFCGSGAEEDCEVFPGCVAYYVRCVSCLAKSGRRTTPEDAREDWNKRIGDDD